MRPYAPGVTGVRLSLQELRKLISGNLGELGKTLTRVLAECAAENLLVSRPSAPSTSRDGGTVFYLNRTLCAHYDLPLQTGGWQDVDATQTYRVDGAGKNSRKTPIFGGFLMLWQHYVFRRGGEIYPMWETLFERRKVRLLYIAGCGFDIRTQKVMREFVRSLRESSAEIDKAELLLVGFSGYRLDQALQDQTKSNQTALTDIFGEIGQPVSVTFGSSNSGDDVSASTAIRQGVAEVQKHLLKE